MFDGNTCTFKHSQTQKTGPQNPLNSEPSPSKVSVHIWEALDFNIDEDDLLGEESQQFVSESQKFTMAGGTLPILKICIIVSLS